MYTGSSIFQLLCYMSFIYSSVYIIYLYFLSVLFPFSVEAEYQDGALSLALCTVSESHLEAPAGG